MMRTPVGALSAAAALMLATGTAMAEKITVVRGDVAAHAIVDARGVLGPVSLEIVRSGHTARFDGLDEPKAAGDSQWGVFGDRPLAIRDLDGDGEPEVLLTLFSGGAHCCARSVVAFWQQTSGTYRLATQDWADAFPRLRDLDVDGQVEFVAWDARWAYWGGSYADSGFPIRIFTFRAGAFVDTTREHPRHVRDDMRRHWTRSRQLDRQGRGVRGALGAYLADAYLLGGRATVASAWRRVYNAYGRWDRLRFFRGLRARLTVLGYRPPGRHVPAVTPPRRHPWRGCRSPVPDIGFVAALQAQGVPCALAARLAREIAPGRPSRGSSFYGFACVQREVAIETIRVRCSRGRYERVRFFTGV